VGVRGDVLFCHAKQGGKQNVPLPGEGDTWIGVFEVEIIPSFKIS